ncbi:hypothetical protein BJ742DRAFT_379106 [Cladochytrium replicatum]|nr:hypothetical protein BJ742DRAFT_379106 [Cladochytrium replicatum]
MAKFHLKALDVRPRNYPKHREPISSYAMSAAAYTFAAVGAAYILKLVLSVASEIISKLPPRLDLRKFGATKGSWAVVTGSSDGIGKEFALQLASSGFNVVLIARTTSKLQQVANEITLQTDSQVETRVIPFDFANASEHDFTLLGERLSSLGDIGVLVNNVAMGHDYPKPFMEETSERIEDIVAVNCLAQLRITRLILPNMLSRKNGLVLNIGSFTGAFPAALMSGYSASKAFMATWSEAVGIELKGSGVHFEYLNTFFVSNGMSKIDKPSLMAPSPKTYVKAALKHSGKSLYSTPYWAHAVENWVYTSLLPRWLLKSQGHQTHKEMRKQALLKQ